MVSDLWQPHELGAICQKISVGLAISVTPHMRPSGVVLIRNQNIRRNQFDGTSVAFLDPVFASRNKSKQVNSGDVIAVRTGSNIGEACVVPKEFDGALTFTTLIARPSPSKLSPMYLSHHINSEIGRAEVNRLMAGGGKPNLNANELKRYRLHLPSLAQQNRIALLLSTWDAALALVEGLVANSRSRKNALMQQLLTGKRRFIGFESSNPSVVARHGTIQKEWCFVRIGDVAHEISERHDQGGMLPVLSCSKYDGFVSSLEYFKKRIYSDDLSNYKIVKRGDFGFPANHIEEGSIGYQDIVDCGVVSPIYTVFRTSDEVVDGYLYKLLKTDHYRQIFSARTNASVDRRGSLRWNEFRNIRIPLPSIEEQKKISEAIDVAARELENLTLQLTALKGQQKALMQQLLTGKRRVKLDTAV